MAAENHAVLIWGAGGHGRVVADVVAATGAKVVGFVDGDRSKVGVLVAGTDAAVVATEAEFGARLAGGQFLPCGATAVALGLGDNRLRSNCRTKLTSSTLPALVHPSAVVSPSAVVGPGVVIMAGVVINAGAVIGAGAIVNTRAIVEHDCIVGDDAHLSPGSVLTGAVTVGRGAWVGAGATVIPAVQIGEWAVVGAGAVVIRNVPASTTVVGNPARVLMHTR
jgi:sugar O-acyltransferase (sialic acid O-acetyltransferase NeuD family)